MSIFKISYFFVFFLFIFFIAEIKNIQNSTKYRICTYNLNR